MRKLLTSLYKKLFSKSRKGEVTIPGPFYGYNQEEIFHLTTVIYDEDEDLEVRVRYVCSCDKYVYEMGAEGSFACMHCDSECKVKGCKVCQYLNGRDLWSDANL